jgi:hypothetical protein
MIKDVPVKCYPESPWPKQHPTKRRFFRGRIGFKFKEETGKSYIWSNALYMYCAGNWTHRKKSQTYLENLKCGV